MARFGEAGFDAVDGITHAIVEISRTQSAAESARQAQ